MVLGSIGTGATVAITIKAIDNFSKNFGKAQTGMQKLGSVFKVGATALAGVAIGLAAVGKSAINAAINFEETSSKFATVFSDVSDQSEVVAKNLQQNFGLSGQAAKELLGDTGDLLSGFGFTGKAALDMSEEVNKLAVDLASFTNASGGSAATSAALTKALLGERESLKTYGIAILDADVKQRVLENGMSGLTGEALRQAKAQATLQLATEQSKNAIGDFARTSDSSANQMRTLQARFDDIKVSLGTELLPVFNDLLVVIADDIIPAITPLIPLIGDALKGALEFITPLLPKITDMFVQLLPVVFELFDALEPLLDPLMEIGDILFPIILDVLKALTPAIKSLAESLVPLLEFLEPIIELIGELISGIAKVGGKALEFVFDTVSKIRGGETTSVGDAIIRPNGDVIKTHPNDTLFATQSPGSMGGDIIINIDKIQGVDADEITELMAKRLSLEIRR